MAEQVPVKGLDVAQVPQKYLIFPCVIDDEQKRVWFCLPTGQEFIHLGLETDVLKRLYDVVGCLVLVALQTVLGQCGEKNDCHLAVQLSNLLGSPQTIHSAHLNIQENEVQGGIIGIDQIGAVPIGADFKGNPGFLCVTGEQGIQVLDKGFLVVTNCYMKQADHLLSFEVRPII